MAILAYPTGPAVKLMDDRGMIAPFTPAGRLLEHLGPGPHPSGSPQSVHGGRGGRALGEYGPVLAKLIPGPPAAMVEAVERRNEEGVRTVLGWNNGLDRFDHGQEVEQARAKIAARLKEVADLGVPAIRVHSEYIEGILKNGYQNQFKTQTSEGTLDPAQRYNSERDMFGIESQRWQDHPVYGYLEVPGVNDQEDAQPHMNDWGDAIIVLKDAVRARTTFCSEDSLSPANTRVTLPTPLDNPHWRAVEYGSMSDLLDDTRPAADLLRDHWPYWEVQIHGGVRAKDIAAVYFDGDPPDGVVELLDAAGIDFGYINVADYD